MLNETCFFIPLQVDRYDCGVELDYGRSEYYACPYYSNCQNIGDEATEDPLRGPDGDCVQVDCVGQPELCPCAYYPYLTLWQDLELPMADRCYEAVDWRKTSLEQIPDPDVEESCVEDCTVNPFEIIQCGQKADSENPYGLPKYYQCPVTPAYENAADPSRQTGLTGVTCKDIKSDGAAQNNCIELPCNDNPEFCDCDENKKLAKCKEEKCKAR